MPSPVSRRAALVLGGGLAASTALGACSRIPGWRGAQQTHPPDRPALRQWAHRYEEAGAQRALRDYAAGYLDAAVTVTTPPGDYERAVAAALTTTGTPDVVEHPNGPTLDMIRAGQLADLTDLVADVRSDFLPGVLRRMSYDGTVYAIPQAVDVQLLAYRPSVLDSAGVRLPASTAELFAAAKALTSPTRKGLFLGNDGGVSTVGGLTLWSVGADHLTRGGDPDFAHPRVYAALAELHRLYHSGSLLLGAPKDWTDADALVSGRTAIQLTGLWALPAMSKALGDDIGVMPWPAGDGGTPSVVVGAYGTMVPARGRSVDAAKSYARWLWVDQGDKQLDFATAYGAHVPARASLVARAQALRAGPQAEAAQLAAKIGHAQSDIRWSAACDAAFTTMMRRVVVDGADPRTEVDVVRAVASKELQRLA